MISCTVQQISGLSNQGSSTEACNTQWTEHKYIQNSGGGSSEEASTTTL